MEDFPLADSSAAPLTTHKLKPLPLPAQRPRALVAACGLLVALTALTAHAQTSCLPPPAELISWWPLDETSGTAVSDVLNKNPGIATGTIGSSSTSTPKSSAALVGNGLFFPNSQVNVNPSSTLPSGTNSFTIDAWIKTTNNSFFPVVRNVDPGTGNSGGYYLMSVDSLMSGYDHQLRFEIGGSPYYLGPAVPDNTWTFIAVVVDFENKTVALCTAPQGGQGIACQGFPLPPGASAGTGLPLVIGGCSGGLSDCSVVLDEVEIFSGAMSITKLGEIWAAGAAGKCRPPPPPKGMTWQRGAVNATNGTVTVGCGSGTTACNPQVGDHLCTDSLPLLCFRPFSPKLPKPAYVVEIPLYNLWSGGIVGTTTPVQASSFGGSLAAANQRCAADFNSPEWRVAEFHDGGGGWNFQAYGNVGTPATRAWVHINDKPNGTCFPN
jgi:hypothetical protein